MTDTFPSLAMSNKNNIEDGEGISFPSLPSFRHVSGRKFVTASHQFEATSPSRPISNITDTSSNPKNLCDVLKNIQGFRPIPPPEDSTNQECDSDDCSLGSLGEINEMNRNFFLIAPQEIEIDGSGSKRIVHKRSPFLSRRDRKRSDEDLDTRICRPRLFAATRKCSSEIMTSSTSSMSRRVFLKPRRCASQVASRPSSC